MLEPRSHAVRSTESKVPHTLDDRPIRHRAAPLPACLVPVVLTLGLLLGAAPARAGDLQVDGSFVSTATTGTPPLDVSSTTRVDDLNSDLLDGYDASAFAPAPTQVLWVAPSGGQFSSIQDALDSITDASANKPYLVRVAPGRYVEKVIMKPWVDVAGSGSGVTFIDWNGNWTVEGSSFAELRDLTVENGGGASGGIGIYNFGAAPRITRVHVSVGSTGSAPIGIYNDASAIAPKPILRQIEVFASGPDAIGVKNDEVSPLMTDVQVEVVGSAAIGVKNHDASPIMRRMQVKARPAVNGETTIIGILNSGDDGHGDGTRMVDVTVSAAGDLTYAISNGGNLYLARLTRVEVEAFSSGSTTIGVRNFEGRVALEDCSVDVAAFSASGLGRAVWNNRSSIQIVRSNLSAGGSGTAYGLRNNDTSGGNDGGPWTATVHQSQIYSPDVAVSSSSSFITKIAATALQVGSVSSAGSLICAGVYDENFTFYADTCP
jgi:hypothetical protein